VKRWAFLLGGLAAWALHFLGVYLLASLADLRASSEQPLWRGAHLAFSLFCGAAVAILAITAWRRAGIGESPERFTNRLAALGAAVALVAILWQSLPAFF
jgi:hypothetical protein